MHDLSVLDVFLKKMFIVFSVKGLIADIEYFPAPVGNDSFSGGFYFIPTYPGSASTPSHRKGLLPSSSHVTVDAIPLVAAPKSGIKLISWFNY